ncbi:glycoside hydrolase family 26 protein [Gordonia alkanivorans]|uniref:glycoside hydrolase family 26 protein n=1 Tax=Gordonia alkanivorans TaxID=84096 RepID=UPI001F4E5795|nr:glycosyl hydrolase [Gordonia alkanivorans]
MAELSAIQRANAIPLITLEAWQPSAGTNQPQFAFARLLSGAFDTDLHRWGAELAQWGRPILLRFAQEMNGTWYPWSIGVNGNSTRSFRAAWSHVHAIVKEHAPNVRFVWAPNVVGEGIRDFTDCYPGAHLVDYLGLDGYNWGAIPGHRWRSAHELFSASIATLMALDANSPIILTEVGCADGDYPSHKAQWIRDFFTLIESNERVSGFLWFQMDKERNWRFNSTRASTYAFREGLAGWASR